MFRRINKIEDKKKGRGKTRRGAWVAQALLAALIAVAICAGAADLLVPDSISAFSDGALPSNPLVGYSYGAGGAAVAASADAVTAAPTGSGAPRRVTVQAKLFGFLPFKPVEVTIYDDVRLYPGGMTFGIKFHTNGVLVVGVSDIETSAGMVSPAKDAGIKSGDVITSAGGKRVTAVTDISSAVEGSQGKPLVINLNRGRQKLSVTLAPVLSLTERKYKAGLWLRDSTAGIGTVTFINPVDLQFGGLGHGITDVDTGELMPLGSGSVVQIKSGGIVRGRDGSPGELKGSFEGGALGAVTANTARGVFGVMDRGWQSLGKPLYQPLPIGLRDTVKTGPATILCDVDGKGVAEYSIVIDKIISKTSESKNFLIKVTDPKLLDLTGGIVQGMSGSPIIQNGHLIGAVTHVLVSDPTMGYGILIENMLSAMGEAEGNE